LTIPDYFITPGLVISERTQNRHSGYFKAKDILDGRVICEWKRLEVYLKENGQSPLTPSENILKVAATVHIKKLMEQYNKRFHIQRFQIKLKKVKKNLKKEWSI
jgi:hypothetical protein